MNLTVAIGWKAIVVNDDVTEDVNDVVAQLPASSSVAAPDTCGAVNRVSDGVASVSKLMFSASSCSNQWRLGLKP